MPKRQTEPPAAIQSLLESAGKYALLEREQEIELGRTIQAAAPIKQLRKERELLSNREVAAALNMTIDQVRRIEGAALRARDKLAAHNMRLVVSIAKKYQHQGLPLEDLIGEGSAGLMIAVERFDPDYCCKFSTFAYWWIRQAITRALGNRSNLIRLPCHVNDKVRKAQGVCRQLHNELGREPTRQELADRLGWTLKDTNKILEVKRRVMSFDHSYLVEGDIPIADVFIDPSQSNAMDTAINSDLRRILLDKMRRALTPEEFNYLVLRWGLDGQGERSMIEIQEELQVTRRRVQSLNYKSMTKLKECSNIGTFRTLKEVL